MIQSRVAAAVCSAILGFVMSGEPAAIGAASHAAAGRDVIAVGWTSSTPLPDAARRRLVAEVRRIWGARGIDVEGLDAPRPDAVLRIELARGMSGPLGVFHRAGQFITVSVDEAERAVRAGLPQPESRDWPEARRQQALGWVLGRAIAHEIGHYLLGPYHVEKGLMRPEFRATELVDPLGAGFDLDGTHATLTRLAAALPVRPRGPIAGRGETSAGRPATAPAARTPGSVLLEASW